MRAPTPISMTFGRSRPDQRLLVIGVLGCLLAIAIGTAAATDYGILIVATAVALVFFGLAIFVYVRDPVLAFLWLWLFEVFNPAISARFGYFSSAGETIRQADEILIVLFVGLTVWRAAQRGLRMPPLKFVLPAVGVAIFGVIGAVVHHVPLMVTALGGWLGLKLWIMVCITLLLPWKSSDITRVYKLLTRVGVFVASVGLVDYLTHAAVSRALQTSIYRFESESFRGEAVHSIFPHPGEYSLFMSLLFALAFTRFAAKHDRRDLALVLLFAGSVVLSLRLKGFLSLATVFIIVAMVQAIANDRGALTILLVGALLFVGAFSIEGNVISQEVSTYTTKTSPRSVLYKTGERIANDNFPIGVGFGRFGSYPSRIFYSPVYDRYEISGIYGLSRPYPEFIDDTTWPSIAGEAGYGGLIIFAMGVMLILFAIVQRLRTSSAETKWISLAALCMMSVLLVTSTAQGVLFDWLAITSFVIILGPALIGGRDSAGASGGPTNH